LAQAEQITSRERLDRARQYMETNDSEALLMAARELIEGIDERQREYDEARKDLKRKKRQGWSVAQLGIKVEKAYKAADSIIEISVFDRLPERTVVSLYHTPVNKGMRARARTLAEQLQARSRGERPSEQADAQWRDLLRQSCEDLEAATRGTLLTPPMLNKKGTKMHFALEEADADRADAVREALALIGVRYKLHAQCLERLP
jgi:hypothetical protein